MKAILIQPPQWTPLNPYFSNATLAAQLRNNQHEVKIRDLNIEYYNHILTKEYVTNAINTAFDMFEPLYQELFKDYSDDKKEEDYSDDFKKMLLRYTKIKEFKNNRMNEVLNIPDVVEESVAIMKCKDRFYSPELLIEAINNIDKALELVSLPYHPSLLEFHNYSNPFFKLTFDSIKEHCLDKTTNMFYEFYYRVIPSIIEEKPDLIGISINSSFQIVPGLTLAMLLKQRSGFHLTVGGNFFGRVVDAFKDHPEFFKLFADSLTVEEGEKPIVELAKYIEGKISIQDVPNLAYLDNGVVKINDTIVPLKLNNVYSPDFEGFPLDLYFTPDIVVSIQASRGCYWRKCSFCDHDFGQNYNIKDLDKLMTEIKYLQEKFGISHFEFIDESMSSTYLKELSTKVLDSGLKINWFNNARLEQDFTKDLLELAYKAGLRMLLWGFESGSNDVMELINKGIDIDKRLDILRDAKESGIWNFAFIFFGFPTETWEDALKTIETVCNNTDIISSYGKSIFTLGKHTRLREDPEKYFITQIHKNEEEFSPSYEFCTSKGMNRMQIEMASKLCIEECNKAYDGPLWMFLRYREVLFLYISKFGAAEVQKCKVSS